MAALSVRITVLLSFGSSLLKRGGVAVQKRKIKGKKIVLLGLFDCSWLSNSNIRVQLFFGWILEYAGYEPPEECRADQGENADQKIIKTSFLALQLAKNYEWVTLSTHMLFDFFFPNLHSLSRCQGILKFFSCLQPLFLELQLGFI